jgi:hypothetical protein
VIGQGAHAVFAGHDRTIRVWKLPGSTLSELERPSIRDEQREFQRLKVHSDREFWRRLLKVPEPRCLRKLSVRPASQPGVSFGCRSTASETLQRLEQRTPRFDGG